MDDTLRHYGVKGMRWGVKRGTLKTKKPSELSNNLKPVPKPEKLNGHAAKPQKSNMYDASHKVAIDHVRAKYLSNEELAARNKRLQLEKTYNELRPKSATEKLINASLKIGTQVLTEVGKEYAKSYVKSFANGTVPIPGQNNVKSNKSSGNANSNEPAPAAASKGPRNASRKK